MDTEPKREKKEKQNKPIKIPYKFEARATAAMAWQFTKEIF
jgi:hypothetical protein